MEKGLSKEKLAFLLAATVEYLVSSVLSKEMMLTIADKPQVQLALAIPPVALASPPVALDNPPKRSSRSNTRKTPKPNPSPSFSPIFTPEETLCSRTLASLKEGIKYIECMYQVKKMRIRHKAKFSKLKLEPLINI